MIQVAGPVILLLASGNRNHEGFRVGNEQKMGVPQTQYPVKKVRGQVVVTWNDSLSSLLRNLSANSRTQTKITPKEVGVIITN